MNIFHKTADRGNRGVGPTFLAAFILLSGCSHVTVETKRNPDTGVYAPVPYKSVAILRSPPQEKYQAIGEIHIQPKANEKPSPGEILKEFRKAAAKIGADAVVLVADPAGLTGGPVAGSEWWKGGSGRGDRHTVVGVAIWYPRAAW